MEIGAITAPPVAGKHRVTASPASAGFVVAHSSEHMIVKRFGTLHLVGFSGDSLPRNCFESLVERHQLFWAEITLRVRFIREISSLLFSHYPIAQLDDLAAVLRSRIKHTNIVAIVAIMHFLPFHWDAEFIDADGLKSVRPCKRHPKMRLTIDQRQLHPVDEFKLVRAGDDSSLISPKESQHSTKSECQCQ